MHRLVYALAVAVLTLGLTVPAQAQETREDEWEENWPEEEAVPEVETPETVIAIPEAQPAPATLPNVGLEIGGGFQTFTERLGDVLEGGAGYNLRAIWGPRSRFALELGYLGAWNEAESTETFDGTSTNVYTNSGEALGRINFFGNRSMLRPFVAGGFNYTRIDSEVDTPIGTLDLDGRDGIGFPLVAGLQYLPTDNLTLSARGNYNILSDFLDDRLGNQWGGQLSIGALF